MGDEDPGALRETGMEADGGWGCDCRRCDAGSGPGTVFHGVVQNVNPVVDVKSRTATATIALSTPVDRSPRLQPGMYASVSIETEIAPGRLIVPREALLVRDQRPLLFTVIKGEASWKYVEAGEQNDTSLEILSGITEGDTAITTGHYTLTDGVRVRIGQLGQ